MIVILLLALSSVSSAKEEKSDSNHENLTAINFSMIFWSNLKDLEAYSFTSKQSAKFLFRCFAVSAVSAVSSETTKQRNRHFGFLSETAKQRNSSR
jgi:hypothetical protein